MQSLHVSRWTPPAVTSLVWLLAAGSLVFWGLRLAAPAPGPAYAPVTDAAPAAADPAVVARALGALPARVAQAAPASGRFSLLGVVAGSSSGGTALIAVDGQPPRPFRVGSTVAPGYVLQSVAPRRAFLGNSGVEALALDMPMLK
ncbi:type II secretion system protein N [Xylophilus sp. GW821-FHT01B05]